MAFSGDLLARVSIILKGRALNASPLKLHSNASLIPLIPEAYIPSRKSPLKFNFFANSTFKSLLNFIEGL